MAIKAYVHKLNVVRFQVLLDRESDPEKRNTLSQLLEEEIALLTAAARAEGEGEVRIQPFK
ncbi:MAG: hypothetical protein JNJ63_02790 [Hyphomonadaceae bacterium]|nr:hypothetical protein [Hyphomonadaceae bacterium]